MVFPKLKQKKSGSNKPQISCEEFFVNIQILKSKLIFALKKLC